jgi:hypothetical protein
MSKDTCDKHPLNVPGWEGSLEELANAVENMRYDKTAKFIFYLSRALSARARRDRFSKKFKLSNQLSSCACALEMAANSVRLAWEICEPFMKGSVDENKAD